MLLPDFVLVCFRLVHVLLSWFYPDFILTLSWFYPDFILILSWFYLDFIQIISGFYLDKIRIKGHGRAFCCHKHRCDLLFQNFVLSKSKNEPSEKNSSHFVLQPTALLTEIFSCLPQMVTMEEWLSADRGYTYCPTTKIESCFSFNL